MTIIIKKEVDNQTTTIGINNNQDQDPTTGHGHLIQQVFEAWARSSCYSVAFGVQVSANLFELNSAAVCTQKSQCELTL